MQKLFLGSAIVGLVLAGAGCSTPEPVDQGSGLSGGDSALLNSIASPPAAQTQTTAQQPVPSASPANTPTALTIEQKLSLTKPSMEIDQSKQYSAILHTTQGDITITFTKGATPVTVNNFVSLARKGFYDGTIFHRVMKGFMIQGGDPLGNGTGGPGYRFNDEPFTGEYTRGTIAMANAGPNTNGSQFFIMHADYPLPKNYVIFGHVTAGLNVVDAIADAAVAPGPTGEVSTPVQPVTVRSVEIHEK